MIPFNNSDRELLRKRLIELAEDDARVTGGADIGSSANSSWDRWSDIDITFGIANGIDVKEVLDEWTIQLNVEFAIVHHFDVRSGTAIYRVILFNNGLELDLSAAPEADFGARTPNFSLLFGRSKQISEFPTPNVQDTIGWGWHHILHANSAIRRRRFWHAEYWISALRNHVLAMRCQRYGLASAQSRGADKLPANELRALDDTLVRSIDQDSLSKALQATSREFFREVDFVDEPLAATLEQAIDGLLNE